MKKARGVFGLFVVGVAAAACGGSTTGGGTATVSGSVGGQSVPVVDSIGVSGTETVMGVSVSTAAVFITNVANTCSVLQNHHDPGSTTSLSLEVIQLGTSVAPGTYTITNGATPTGETEATYFATNASCETVTNTNALTGSITLTAVSSTSVQGTFDVTLASGDHLTGSFDAPVCESAAALEGMIASDGGVSEVCGS